MSLLLLIYPDLSTSSGYPQQLMEVPPSKGYLYAPKSFPLMSFQRGQWPLVRLSTVDISLIFSHSFGWAAVAAASWTSNRQLIGTDLINVLEKEAACLWTTFMVMHTGQGIFPPTYLCYHSEHKIYISGRKQYFSETLIINAGNLSVMGKRLHSLTLHHSFLAKNIYSVAPYHLPSKIYW